MQAKSEVPIGATRRTFEILEYVKTAGPIGVSAVARELDLPTSTANDYLQSLRRLGYLQQTVEGYRLGLRFLDLGMSARRDRTIVDVATDEVDRLAKQTGEHANLMIEEGGRGIFVYKATGDNAVTVDTYPGMVVPLHTTALGKTILAHMAEDHVAEIVDKHGLKAVTENTIGTKKKLREALARVRERGYARDDEERIKGMRCVAAPIVHDGEVVAAVSASGPVTRFQGEQFEETLPMQVQSAANVIEVNMSHM
jgi:DNA-binding IclR family transcriptional regulator